VQDLGQFAAELVSEADDEDFLRVELDDTHERFVKFEHALGQQCDFMGLFG